MPQRTLMSIFGGCLAFAVWPVLPWLVALIFDAVNEPWSGSLGAFTYTIPIALGLSAIALAVHGVLLHEQLVDQLESEYPTLAGGALAAEMVPAVGNVPTAGRAAGQAAANSPDAVEAESADAAPARGGRMAVKERPKGFGSSDGKKEPKARKVGRRLGQQAKWRAGSAIRRGIRNRF